MSRESFHLLFWAFGVFAVILVDEITKDNLSNIFRAIIIFHFGLITLWIIGAAIKSIRLISLWSLFIFLAVLAILRISSITLNGLPDFMIIIYLTFEIFGSAISLWLIKGMKKNKSNL